MNPPLPMNPPPLPLDPLEVEVETLLPLTLEPLLEVETVAAKPLEENPPLEVVELEVEVEQILE